MTSDRLGPSLMELLKSEIETAKEIIRNLAAENQELRTRLATRENEEHYEAHRKKGEAVRRIVDQWRRHHFLYPEHWKIFTEKIERGEDPSLPGCSNDLVTIYSRWLREENPLLAASLEFRKSRFDHVRPWADPWTEFDELQRGQR